MQKSDEYYEIDILKLLKALWHKLWVILLSAILLGVGAFTFSTHFIAPTYEAQALMYVNNSSFTVGNTSFSISTSELTAAQNLVDTYIVILKTRTTLNEVIKKAELDYSFEELKAMISSAAVNNTEVFGIKVTSKSPEEAELIANTIAQILPSKIAAVVEGSSVRIVDYAVLPGQKVAPNITKITAMGLLLGVFLSCAVIVIYSLLDTKIHSEAYLMQTYDLPVLAVIPDVFPIKSKSAYEAKGR